MLLQGAQIHAEYEPAMLAVSNDHVTFMQRYLKSGYED